jgi:hypothetical protein
MATHFKLSRPLRAAVALVALAFGACSSGSGEEPARDGSGRHLDGAQAGTAPAAVAGAGGGSDGSGGAGHPDGEATGNTGSVGEEEPNEEGEGQGGSPPGAGGAGEDAGGAGVAEPPGPSEAFLRGEALVTENQCVTCHQRNFAGFTVFPNITPDVETGIGGWTDAQIVAAIRDGVAADGASLCVTMQRYPFSDEQASDVVAFLRGVSAVSHRLTSVCPGHGD